MGVGEPFMMRRNQGLGRGIVEGRHIEAGSIRRLRYSSFELVHHGIIFFTSLVKVANSHAKNNKILFSDY